LEYVSEGLAQLGAGYMTMLSSDAHVTHSQGSGSGGFVRQFNKSAKLEHLSGAKFKNNELNFAGNQKFSTK